jgi:hypothetical protein
MHREARLSPTPAGTMMIDDERALSRLAPGPRRSQTFRLSAARAPSAVRPRRSTTVTYCKLDKHRNIIPNLAWAYEGASGFFCLFFFEIDLFFFRVCFRFQMEYASVPLPPFPTQQKANLIGTLIK